MSVRVLGFFFFFFGGGGGGVEGFRVLGFRGLVVRKGRAEGKQVWGVGLRGFKCRFSGFRGQSWRL